MEDNELNINKTKVLSWVDSTNKILPTAIVLHWWGIPNWLGGLKYTLWTLKRRKLSVQFLILKNGDVHQLVETPDVYCEHARCANRSSIGIELQGLGRKDLDNQSEQFNSLVSLTRKLINQFEIQTKFRFDLGKEPVFYGVTSHKQVDRYCEHSKRLIKKRDVHDEYVSRLIQSL